MFRRRDTSKKYELVKISLLYQTKEFFNHSTLHGVRYIAEEGRPFIDKFLWLCCTSIGATVTLIIIASLWGKFQTNPTITGLDTDFHNWDVPFPGVSLCQDNPVDETLVDDLISKEYSNVKPVEQLKAYLTAIGRITPYKLPELAKFIEYKDFPQNNFREIGRKIMNKCENITAECSWKDVKVSCCEYFSPVLTENGFCFAFNVLPNQGVIFLDQSKAAGIKTEYIYETDPKWAMEVNVIHADTNGVKIYLHSDNEQPGIDLEPHHQWDKRVQKIAFSAKTTYTTEDAYQLNIKQRRCVFPKEIKLLTTDTYSYGACMRECRMKAMYEKCKCVPFYYMELAIYPQCDIKGITCLTNYKDDIVTSKTICPCELCCDNTVYEVEKLSEPDTTTVQEVEDRSIEIAFVSWPMIRYKREVLFGWVDLLVSFGGIAGLFLGFSLLSGIEIIYYFTMRACCMLAREQDALETLRKEYELKDKKPLDLSMTPYFMRKNDETSLIATSNRPIKIVQPLHY